MLRFSDIPDFLCALVELGAPVALVLAILLPLCF